MDYVLPEALRVRLKKPLGTLFKDAVSARKTLAGKKVIAVGDKVAESLLSAGVDLQVCVYDAKTLRAEIDVPKEIESFGREMRVRNPAGRITSEAREALGTAIGSGEKIRVFVDGEEDLLTLAAVRSAPDGWVVAYGQPGEGLVTVELSQKTKKEVEEIFDLMKNEN